VPTWETKLPPSCPRTHISPLWPPPPCDITDTHAVPSWIEEHCRTHGQPHGLAILTYSSTGKKLADLTAEDFDLANHSNLTATFVFAREIANRMAAKRKGGSIVLFSSMYGSVAPDPGIYEAPMNPNPLEYGVSKAGILQMTRYFATHFGSRNVRVNAITPGPFPHPPMQRDSPAFMERLARKNPLGRIGHADEIAGSVAFLLSDAASYITGVNLPVDGGWTAW
jgi:NAD(P)-dependent dehydrogenase (short-subunit alcohol dehydrogenase family)